MNTRKDFIRAALIVRALPTFAEQNAATEAFVSFFAADNPRFDEQRFRDATDALLTSALTINGVTTIGRRVAGRDA